MPAEQSLVTAFWRHHGLAQGDRAQRLAAQELFWAVQAVGASVDAGSPDVLDLLDALLGAPDSDPCYLGAGPVEDLNVDDGERWQDALAQRCRTSSRWREVVASVWLDDQERARVPLLRPYLVEDVPPPVEARRPRPRRRSRERRR